jgi:hypothetical protein
MRAGRTEGIKLILVTNYNDAFTAYLNFLNKWLAGNSIPDMGYHFKGLKIYFKVH